MISELAIQELSKRIDELNKVTSDLFDRQHEANGVIFDKLDKVCDSISVISSNQKDIQKTVAIINTWKAKEDKKDEIKYSLKENFKFALFLVVVTFVLNQSANRFDLLAITKQSEATNIAKKKEDIEN